MQLALEDILVGRKKLREAARYYCIPESSIRAWKSGKVSSRKSGPSIVLTAEEENALVEWCEERQRVAHCVSLTLLRCKVQQICEGRSTPFTNGIPGKHWWKYFCKRHPKLVLRRPEGLDVQRARSLSKEACERFYKFLGETYSAGGYPPSRIWNADEIRLSTAQKNGSVKVIGVKGSRNVMSTTSSNRQWMTIMVCSNALGYSIPNLYIFTGVRVREDYVGDCEQGAKMAMQENGWITEEIFLGWLDHFRESVPRGVSQEFKHLLLVDGHKTHMTLVVVTKAACLGIDIALLPPHTTHRLQPLDVAVFKSFKTNFLAIRDRFIARNPSWASGDFSRKSLAALSSEALQQALSVSNIQSGFRKTGIYLLNPKAMVLEYSPSTLFEEHVDNDTCSDHDEEDPCASFNEDSMPTSAMIASIVYPSR